MGVFDSLRHGLWNAFRNHEEEMVRPDVAPGTSIVTSYGSRPHTPRPAFSNEKSIVHTILNRLAVDVSDVELRHAKVDPETETYVETMKNSSLQYCFSQEANLDQAARTFRKDVAMMLFTRGAAAVVPVETSGDPTLGDSYEIRDMRVGEVIQWGPRHVMVRLYDERDGTFKDIPVEKRTTAIIENPFYPVMNEPNSTFQRLIRKLSLLDVTDEKLSSGKLDLIIQLPYTVKTEARRDQAEQRRRDIEFQLASGPYGIAYADATEKITQLNRPVENNLLEQVTYLMGIVFSQLGLTEEIMNGTAEEGAMINYMSRTIEPVIDAIAEGFQRKFLSRNARTRGERVLYFRDPFKLIPISKLADVTDVFSRNEVASPNEIRKAIGWIPSKDPKADQLHNSNMSADGQPQRTITRTPPSPSSVVQTPTE